MNFDHLSLTRHDFLVQAGTAALGLAAAAVLPAVAQADPDSGPAPTVRLGSGEHTYDCINEWLTPPPNILFGDTHGVVQDSKGRIYIAHTVAHNSPSDDSIVVYDKNGKFLSSWGARFKGGAHGLDIRKEGRHEFLYHCDIGHRKVVKTDLDGTVIWEKDAPAEAGVYDAQHKFVPTNVALTNHGDFYVGDGYGSSYIHQYDAKANYVRTFGGPGKEPGQTTTPHGLWIDHRAGIGTGGEPLLVVADRGNRRLQYFTLDGKHVSFVTEGMRQPCHFDIRGDELLVPDLDSIITILDKDNKVAAQLGDGATNGTPSTLRGAPRSQFIPGKFIHPHSAKFLHNGDILVVEWVPQGRVTLLRKVKA
jgi:hypothetical protein